jgi:omega-6 fatty acid desaturase (delta-12 desaturase)
MPFNPIVIVTRGEKPAWYQDTAPYARASLRKAIWQLSTTLAAYFLLFALMVYTVRHDYPYVVTLALAVCGAALFVRIFIFFHDCTHGAFLPSPRWNRNVGYLCGLMTFTPFHDWRRSHAGHHMSAGNLDRRGIGDITLMTVAEYQAASPLRRLAYRLYRHPLVTFVIGPTYYFLVRNRYPSKIAKKPDVYSVVIIDLALLVMVTLAGLTIGLRTYLLVQGPIIVFAASAGIWLFYIQHQFQGVYWARQASWDPWRVALEGASYYQLPRWLHWATGNIGFHHIHHARPGIPNYRLRECHEGVPVLKSVRPLTLRESLGTVGFKLWDEDRQRLVGFRHQVADGQHAK